MRYRQPSSWVSERQLPSPSASHSYTSQPVSSPSQPGLVPVLVSVSSSASGVSKNTRCPFSERLRVNAASEAGPTPPPSPVSSASPTGGVSRFGLQETQVRRPGAPSGPGRRSEEHTSELQSRSDLVCRLLLEKKK